MRTMMMFAVLFGAMLGAFASAAQVPNVRHNALTLEKLRADTIEHLSSGALAAFPHLTKQQAEDMSRVVRMRVENEPSALHNDAALTSDRFCDALPPSSTRPTNVNALRPADVEVVAALGDSLVAAFGALARSIFEVFTEYRQASYAGGALGQTRGEVKDTLQVKLEVFTADHHKIVGGAVGTGKATSANARYNQAVSGAKACDLMDQASTLIDMMRKANHTHAWKVVTIMVGPNNLCAYCQDREKHAPKVVLGCFRQAIAMLKAELPNTLVNVVGVFDVTRMNEFSSGFCGLLHGYECPCGVNKNKEIRDEVSAAAKQYNQGLVSLVKEFDSDTFAAVLQQWPLETHIPRTDGGVPDKSYLAPDCFHFSGKGHTAASEALWNNMFESNECKADKWYPGEPLDCPTEQYPYICTNQNQCAPCSRK